MKEENYLTNIPGICNEHGFPKVLAVRREIIHIKHILTEIFVRKSIDISPMLENLGMDLFGYMEQMTNRIRRIHYFPRQWNRNCQDVVDTSRNKFFPVIDLYRGMRIGVGLDFDGVCTKRFFQENFYNRLRDNTFIDLFVCSANPTITDDWFHKRGLTPPRNIFSMTGKTKKIRKLVNLSQRYHYTFFVDNETEYLDYAWIFGIHTYHYVSRTIKYYTRKTK